MLFDSRFLTLPKINSSYNGIYFPFSEPSSLIGTEYLHFLKIKKPKDIDSELNLSNISCLIYET